MAAPRALGSVRTRWVWMTKPTSYWLGFSPFKVTALSSPAPQGQSLLLRCISAQARAGRTPDWATAAEGIGRANSRRQSPTPSHSSWNSVAELLGPHRPPQPGLSPSPTQSRRREDGGTTDPPARLQGDGLEETAERPAPGPSPPLHLARSPARPPGPREAAPRSRESCEGGGKAAAAPGTRLRAERERSAALIKIK